MTSADRQQLAADVTADQLLTTLATEIGADREAPQSIRRVLLDTFDWALVRAGRLLVHEEGPDPNGKPSRILRLIDKETGRLDVAARCPGRRVLPQFPEDLPAGPLREKVRAEISVRALIPRIEVQSRRHLALLRNADGKTVLRATVDDRGRATRPAHPAFPDSDGSDAKTRIGLAPTLRIESVRGYEGVAATAHAALADAGVAGEPTADPLLVGLDALGERPGEDPSKARYELTRDETVTAAVHDVFDHLAASLGWHEPGMRHAVDIEFLHDYRVTVRRLRSAVGAFRPVLAPAFLERFTADLKWLGTETTPARDLDVYLETLPRYEDWLGSHDLEPLRRLLEKRRKAAYTRIGKVLDSARYERLIQDLDEALDAPDDLVTDHETDCGSFADRRLRQRFRRILRDGRRIGDSSPAESLHELRKDCKKLRYGLEFFRSLYPSSKVQKLVRAMKRLQDNLGDFQDYEVQAEFLREIGPQTASAARNPDSAAQTLLAMGALVDRLAREQQRARDEFAERFATFDTESVRELANKLFGTRAKQ